MHLLELFHMTLLIGSDGIIGIDDMEILVGLQEHPLSKFFRPDLGYFDPKVHQDVMESLRKPKSGWSTEDKVFFWASVGAGFVFYWIK